MGTLTKKWGTSQNVSYPKREVVAFAGDGGLSMLVWRTGDRHALSAADQGRRPQEKYAGQIKWEQMMFVGNRSQQTAAAA